jgi:SAM-dependent methyltransferase
MTGFRNSIFFRLIMAAYRGWVGVQGKLYRLLFTLNGMKPWSRGYSEYKMQSIRNMLSSGDFRAEKLPGKYGFRLDERIVEYPWFFSRLPKSEEGKLLDAGSVLNYDFILEHQALKSKCMFISTLAPEARSYWYRGVSYVYEDLRSSCFRDDYFDWITSLSTIEHIGLDNTMLYSPDTSKKENAAITCLAAVKEYRRMLKPGGVLYLSFPFGRHENHGWFQIFDAAMLDQVIEAFAPSSVIEFHYRYEPDGWCVSSREESEGATYFDIHTQKTYDVDFAAASRAIVCLEMVK